MTPFVLALALLTPQAAEIDHRTAPDHPMQYLVSRPVGWKAGESYPVVVAIPAAERDFAAYCKHFVHARGNRRFLIVTPYVLTDGGSRIRGIPEYPYDSDTWDRIEKDGHWRFDLAGLEAVLKDVHAKDGGKEKAFVTGLEAAGHTVFALAFDRPDLVAAAGPVAPNYQGRWLASAAKGPRPQMIVFAGGEDPGWAPGSPLFEQTEEAKKEALSRGFGAVQTHIVPGKGHEALAEAVLDWFESLDKR
ncbi:MAG: hypothetical protein JSS66_10160 [Armatimonadetes bacterium]|nr:hypothetical protein [Armatimonadota bacterium]